MNPGGTGRPLLLYDGECGLCNAIVRILLRLDRRCVLTFAPLQGTTGQHYLKLYGLETGDFDSIVLVRDMDRRDAGYLRRTDAIVALLPLTGAIGNLIGAGFGVIPQRIRDGLYRIVARTRYRLFGEYKPTPLPNPDWARRILQ